MLKEHFSAFIDSIKEGNQTHFDRILNTRLNLINLRHHQNGLTPLFSALHHCQTNIAKHLLRKGADANLSLDGELPIDYVVYSWHTDEEDTLCLINKLLKYGATPTSALCNWSAMMDNQALFEICLKAKVSVNSRDKNKKTPLISAIHSNRVDMINRLLKEGADPNIQVENLMPLEHVITHIKDTDDKSQVIENLLHHGAIRTDAFFDWLAESISQSSIQGYLDHEL